MTPDDPHKRTSTRQKWLVLVAAFTLAATVWAAMQPTELADTADAAPPPIHQAVSDSPGKAPNPRSLHERAASAPAAHPLSWPDSSHLDARSPWRAALPQGASAWSGLPPALAPAPTAPVAPPAPAIAVAVAIAAAAPPPVPAFPYQLIGRLDDGVPQALLSDTSRSFGVKAGDAIDGQWRVDSVEAQSITVTWLRTGARKTLSFASS